MNNDNKSKRHNRVQLEWAKVLNCYEYIILDYVLFRSNLTESNNNNGWEFHVRQIASETNVSKDTISRTFKKWPFIKKIGEGQFSKFIFDYNNCISYINELVSNRDKGVSMGDTLVSTRDKVVSPSVHIKNIEVIEKENKEVIEKIVVKNNIENSETVTKYKNKGYIWIREEILKNDSVLTNKEKLELGNYYKVHYWNSVTSSTIKDMIEEKLEQLVLEEN